MPEVITDNLDLWSSALLTRSTAGRGNNSKLEAYGIKKLRELILELAVRGKLLPQDPSDEPASVLLEKIAKEKLRLIKKGKIKKEKSLPEIAEEEMDYELPSGWVFVRLGDIAYSQAGFAFKSTFFNENSVGLPLIRIRDVGQPFTGTYYSGEYREEFLVEKGDYLISMDGEFRVSPWTNGSALMNQRVSRLMFYYENVGQRFIADSLQARLRELQGVKAYTTVDHLSGTQITEAVIGLPPLAEQHRIVAKVDELMALCDQLEQQQTHSIAAHQTLVEILLATLTRVESQHEFSEAWARIASHFDILFTTEASIDQLKQTILQLAVMGKLVPQDPNDEPASALLGRIAAKEERANKATEATKQTSLLEIGDEEKLFNLPNGWSWARGESVADFVDPHPSHRTPPEYQGGVPYVGYTDIDHEKGIDFENARKVDPKVFEEHQNRYQLKAGDFVFGKIGTLGEPFFLPEPFDYCLSANLILIQPNLSAIHPRYLAMFLDSPWFLGVMGEQKTNSTHSVFGIKKARLICLPEPPLAEQHRIVAKVDKLMSLCDTLKARLADAKITQLHLADAIVEQAVC